MSSSSRIHKSLMNAKVEFTFYILSIILAFFSRRIFLECLGAEFIGLAGTLGSILNFLNVSEIGIGTCIGYFLYKPIEQGDRQTISEIVSLFGWLYRIVGTIILAGAAIISLFFPLIFHDAQMPFTLIYFTFYSFLLSNLLTYYINYRRILLDSDQKTYKISAWAQTVTIAKTLVQIILAYYYKNLYVWVAIELAFAFCVCWIINTVIDREYPWLTTDKSKGREILKKYPQVLVKAKQIFIHRMKNFFLSKSDEILIFAFESLQMVAYYGNYTMIVGKLTGLFNQVLVGMNAGIGNLVAEGNKWNIRKVFWEHLTFRYWATGCIIIPLAFLINPVIGWWVGEQYVLQLHLVVLILLNMYIMFTGPAVALFTNAYGLYDDTWSAYAEAFVNLSITLVVGWQYGLVGILLGKVVSLCAFAVVWRPWYLYKKGFQESTGSYWRGIFIHIAILASCMALNFSIVKAFNIEIQSSLLSIMRYILCISLPVIIVYSALIWLFAPNARYLLLRLRKQNGQKA